jgi:hypothetical protein
MGLDTKTYWLTDRQSQYDFDFDFWIIIERISWEGSRSWLRRDDNELVEICTSACEKKTSCVLQLQWDWCNYCVEIRCQDTTSEDWEP